MFLVFLMLFTVTVAVEDCEYTIRLERGEIRRIPSPSYPNNDEQLTRCRWTVIAPPHDARGIVFNCPFPHKPPAPNNEETEGLPCHGHFSITPEDENTTPFCTDRAFSRTTTKSKMVVTYWVPENVNVEHFVCYAYEDEKRPKDAQVSNLYGCDYDIELQPGVTQQLQTKYFPKPDPPGSSCAWKVTSTVYNSRIKLSCPTYKQDTCTAWFELFRYFDPKYHCNDKPITEYSTGNTMLLLYNTNMTNRPVEPLQCFISVEDPISLVPTTVSPPTGQKFEGCDHDITLKMNQFYEINQPTKVPCRWWAKAPVDTRIHVTCPKLYQIEDKCTGIFTLKRLIEPLSYCNNKRFAEYSDSNQAILEFNTLDTNSVYSGFKCYFSVEKLANVCQCGRRNTARILNGEDTGINEFPMMAGLRYFKHIAFFCGATIISDRYALTAAICVNNKHAKAIALVVGEHDRSKADETWSTEIHEIDQIIVHPEFQRTNIKGYVENDIALVHVTTQIRFNSKVGPACLPFSRKTDFFVDQDVVSLGWGKTGRNATSSLILQKLKGFVWADFECMKVFSDFPVKQNQLCVTSDNRGSCKGDSGGPVLWTEPKTNKLILIGIHSTDRLCTRVRKPSIKARVTSYLDWIEESAPDAKFCKE